MLDIPGFGHAGKANLPRTLALDLVHTFCAGWFLKSTVTAFSSFSELFLCHAESEH